LPKAQTAQGCFKADHLVLQTQEIAPLGRLLPHLTALALHLGVEGFVRIGEQDIRLGGPVDLGADQGVVKKIGLTFSLFPATLFLLRPGEAFRLTATHLLLRSRTAIGQISDRSFVLS